ncbi:MAG: hypothetical protein SWJ54_16205, partial [Cyanobacteriota bacterium]|nr:hypothetical protein [Cyanobacteriota bacterium]
MLQRSPKIAAIIEKRRPLAQKIESVDNNLRELSRVLSELENYRNQLLKRVDDVGIKGHLLDLDFLRLQLEINAGLDTLTKLKVRFSRDTLNIGVVGRARQGKSRLLQSLTGLTGNPYILSSQIVELELHENAFTNIGYGFIAAQKLLAHHPKGKAKQHVILISDGDATAPHPSPQRFALRQAAKVARRGITISCVCINEES